MTRLADLTVPDSRHPRLELWVVEHTDLLHGHATAEHGGDGEVSAVARVAGGHHVLGVEHLLDELRHGQCAVLLAAARRQRREAGHEEVQARERHHVDGQLA